MNIFHNTPYGFQWGAARVERCMSDDKKQWVVLSLTTPKHKDGHGIQIYVTKSGKIRVHGPDSKEWLPKKKRGAK